MRAGRDKARTRGGGITNGLRAKLEREGLAITPAGYRRRDEPPCGQRLQRGHVELASAVPHDFDTARHARRIQRKLDYDPPLDSIQ